MKNKIEYEKDGVRLTLEVIDEKEFNLTAFKENAEVEEMFLEEAKIHTQAQAQALAEGAEEDLNNILEEAAEIVDYMKSARYYETVVRAFGLGKLKDDPEGYRKQQEWLESMWGGSE